MINLAPTLTRRLVLLLAVLAASAAVTAPAASAGSNGQQVYIEGYKQYSVIVCGQNQYRVTTCTPRWQTPRYVTWIGGGADWLNTGAPRGAAQFYWWGGHLTIFTFGKNGLYIGARGCDVPWVHPMPSATPNAWFCIVG